VVVSDPNIGDGTGSWNDGYGHFLLIEHPNGTKTRYAHLQSMMVSVGQYVNQGDRIALMGNTGNTHGPTGCHLHFEVLGAKNPFAK
jgi:murein DD-endopeptidase MepM/ murein hydrolase activator NlpD